MQSGSLTPQARSLTSPAHPALAQDRGPGMIAVMKWLYRPAPALFLALLLGVAGSPGHAGAADFTAQLDALRAVGPEGAGAEEAAAAWKILATAPPDFLPALLQSLDGANPLAQNWLRAAASTIADRAQRDGLAVPLDALTSFLQETNHAANARVLAWDLIRSADAARADSMIMNFLQDPAADLRRPGVTRLLEETAAQLAAGKKEEAASTAEKAFQAARDDDQITLAVDQLKELGRSPDVATHLGLILDWKLLAPFSNVTRAGFAATYPPEEKLDLAASYPLADGTTIAWQPFRSTEPYGHIDFNTPFGLLKEATGYATTTYEAPEALQAELRIGTGNAWKVWLNGTFLFGRDEYHRGSRLDQYTLPINLKKGPNTILVKICQNEQTETWTVDWRFQLRLCDSTGTALTAASPQ